MTLVLTVALTEPCIWQPVIAKKSGQFWNWFESGSGISGVSEHEEDTYVTRILSINASACTHNHLNM